MEGTSGTHGITTCTVCSTSCRRPAHRSYDTTRLSPTREAFTWDRFERNLLQGLLDEQSMWIRKLTEVLTEVVLFSRTNSPEHFRHYLLVNELKRVRRAITNANDFYECSVENYRNQESDLVAQITAVESNLILANCWYLAYARVGGRHSGTTAKLSSFRDRLVEAMGVADRNLRCFLGLSYDQGYGGVSEQIHLTVGRVPSRRGWETGPGKLAAKMGGRAFVPWRSRARPHRWKQRPTRSSACWRRLGSASGPAGRQSPPAGRRRFETSCFRRDYTHGPPAGRGR